MAAPAAAASAGTCSKLTWSNTGKVVLSGCTATAATGGGGTFRWSLSGPGDSNCQNVKITWKGGHGTTTDHMCETDAFRSDKPDPCPSPTQYYDRFAGPVTKSTGAAAKSIPKGAKISAYVCLDGNYPFYGAGGKLAPKTKFVF